MRQPRLFDDAPPLAVCWGAGWDSTAMLIEMRDRGMRPDLITFADTGAEKPGTYEFLPVFTEWCADQDFPSPVVCVYQPLDKTHHRYRSTVEALVAEHGWQVTAQQVERLSRLFGNMVANRTMPGICFHNKSCSVKWKIEAQEFH